MAATVSFTELLPVLDALQCKMTSRYSSCVVGATFEDVEGSVTTFTELLCGALCIQSRNAWAALDQQEKTATPTPAVSPITTAEHNRHSGVSRLGRYSMRA